MISIANRHINTILNKSNLKKRKKVNFDWIALVSDFADNQQQGAKKR